MKNNKNIRLEANERSQAVRSTNATVREFFQKNISNSEIKYDSLSDDCYFSNSNNTGDNADNKSLKLENTCLISDNGNLVVLTNIVFKIIKNQTFDFPVVASSNKNKSNLKKINVKDLVPSEDFIAKLNNANEKNEDKYKIIGNSYLSNEDLLYANQVLNADLQALLDQDIDTLDKRISNFVSTVFDDTSSKFLLTLFVKNNSMQYVIDRVNYLNNNDIDSLVVYPYSTDTGDLTPTKIDFNAFNTISKLNLIEKQYNKTITMLEEETLSKEFVKTMLDGLAYNNGTNITKNNFINYNGFGQMLQAGYGNKWKTLKNNNIKISDINSKMLKVAADTFKEQPLSKGIAINFLGILADGTRIYKLVIYKNDSGTISTVKEYSNFNNDNVSDNDIVYSIITNANTNVYNLLLNKKTLSINTLFSDFYLMFWVSIGYKIEDLNKNPVRESYDIYNNIILESTNQKARSRVKQYTRRSVAYSLVVYYTEYDFINHLFGDSSIYNLKQKSKNTVISKQKSFALFNNINNTINKMGPKTGHYVNASERDDFTTYIDNLINFIKKDVSQEYLTGLLQIYRQDHFGWIDLKDYVTAAQDLGVEGNIITKDEENKLSKKIYTSIVNYQNSLSAYGVYSDKFPYVPTDQMPITALAVNWFNRNLWDFVIKDIETIESSNH